MKILETEKYKKIAQAPTSALTPPMVPPVNPAPGDEEVSETTTVKAQNVDTKELLTKLTNLLKTNTDNLDFLKKTEQSLRVIANDVQKWWDLLKRFEQGTILNDEQKKAIQLTPQRMWMFNLYNKNIDTLLKEIDKQQRQMQTSIDSVQETTTTIQYSE